MLRWTILLKCFHSPVHSGHVGAPLPCNSIKLVDVAEMNYLAANGEGEVRTAAPVAVKYIYTVRVVTTQPDKSEEHTCLMSVLLLKRLYSRAEYSST